MAYHRAMQPIVIAQVLALLALANGTPVLAKKIFGARFACPLDCGIRFLDGRPLFGVSKTLRGLALAIVVTAVLAPLIGLNMETGAAVAAAAMIGDLFSSFLKRRMNLAPSSQALGLDQVPESLFPLLVCRNALSLTAVDIAVVVAAFFVAELLLSRLLYKLKIRDRPY